MDIFHDRSELYFLCQNLDALFVPMNDGQLLLFSDPILSLQANSNETSFVSETLCQTSCLFGQNFN